MSCKKCNTNKCTCETNLCINPLIYLVKTALPIIQNYIPEIKEVIDNNNGGKAAVGLKEEGGILDTYDPSLYINLSMTNSGTLCCPDCKNGIYYLGNQDYFNQIADAGERFCCIESLGLNLKESKNANIKCCDTDFLSAVQNWIQQLSNYDLANASFSIGDINSIVESSSFNGYSGLGIVLNFLQLNYPDLDPVLYVLFIGVILTYGIVIKCEGCKITFYTAQTYLDAMPKPAAA